MVSVSNIVKIGLLIGTVVAFAKLQGFELLGSGIREVKSLKDSVRKISDERTDNSAKQANNRSKGDE